MTQPTTSMTYNDPIFFNFANYLGKTDSSLTDSTTFLVDTPKLPTNYLAEIGCKLFLTNDVMLTYNVEDPMLTSTLGLNICPAFSNIEADITLLSGPTATFPFFSFNSLTQEFEIYTADNQYAGAYEFEITM